MLAKCWLVTVLEDELRTVAIDVDAYLSQEGTKASAGSGAGG